MIHEGMLVVSRPRQTAIEIDVALGIKLHSLVNLLDSTFITVIAPMAPRKTAIRDFCTDMIDVMKNVLSPNSDAVISDEEAMKEFQKVLATAYGVILLVVG